MNLHYQRGLLLYQQDRLAMAADELRLAVGEEPDDPRYRATLALCLADQGQLDAAEEEVEQAIGRGPTYPLAHLARTHILHKRGRLPEAERSIGEVLRLDPTSPEAHATLAAVRYDRGNWSGALKAADDGLAYDPHNARCATLRTMALTQLGRTTEAVEAASDALRHNPSNASAHEAQAWAKLQQSDPKAALEHFREALRLDPTSTYARAGMIEALKARYWLYRQLLRFFLWMGRLSPTARWGVLIGLVIAQQLLGRVAANAPAIRPFVLPMQYALFGFVMSTWLAPPLFNLLLRLNKYGRHALSPDQRRQSHWVAGLILLGLGAVAVWVAASQPIALFGEVTAFTCLWILMPISAVFQVPTGWPRRIMVLYSIAMLIVYGVMIWNFVDALDRFAHQDEAAGKISARGGWDAFEVNMWAALASGFLTNWLMSRSRY